MNTKRKGIYKILIILTTIVCLMNGCVRLFNTFADTVNEGSTIIIEDRMPEDFQRILSRNDISYIWFTRIINDTDRQTQYQTYYCPLDDDLEYSLSGDTFIFSDSGDSNVYHTYDGYHKQDGTWGHGSSNNSFSRTTINEFTVNMSDKIVNDLNCEAIKLCINGTIYDSNALNVEVSFSPALVGVVDREIDNNGVKSYLSELKMTVINHCSYPIQYKMDITAKEQSNTRPANSSANLNTYYSDDAVFKFYKESWVWNTSELGNDHNSGSASSSNPHGLWDNIPMKYNKASEWHYLAAKDTNNQTFKYTQINLHEGVEYTVTVYACPARDDYVTENFTSDTSNLNEYTFDSSTVEIVYQSDFSMLHYSDVVYNPNDTSNGIVPYNGYDGAAPSQKLNNSYNAWETLDGDKGYNSYDGLPSYSPGGYSSGSVQLNGDYNRVLAQTSSVFLFISNVLGYFPTDIFIVLNICLWSIVIIVIIRRLK